MKLAARSILVFEQAITTSTVRLLSYSSILLDKSSYLYRSILSISVPGRRRRGDEGDNYADDYDGKAPSILRFKQTHIRIPATTKKQLGCLDLETLGVFVLPPHSSHASEESQ